LNTLTAASTPRRRPRHLDSSFEYLGGGLDTSIAALYLDRLEHLNGGLDTLTAALTP
jgi:hypothetical protein